jgi:dihydroorotase
MLLEGLRDGVIEVIASDHAPHDLDSKRVEFSKAAFGIIGFPTTVPLFLEFVHKKMFSPYDMARLLAHNPCQVFGLAGGALSGRADVTIIDPQHEWVFSEADVHSKSKNSPYFGRSFRGKAKAVIVDGEVLVDNFVFTGEKSE